MDVAVMMPQLAQHLSLHHCGELCLPVRKGSGLGLNRHELYTSLGLKLLPTSFSTLSLGLAHLQVSFVLVTWTSAWHFLPSLTVHWLMSLPVCQSISSNHDYWMHPHNPAWACLGLVHLRNTEISFFTLYLHGHVVILNPVVRTEVPPSDHVSSLG